MEIAREIGVRARPQRVRGAGVVREWRCADVRLCVQGERMAGVLLVVGEPWRRKSEGRGRRGGGGRGGGGGGVAYIPMYG